MITPTPVIGCTPGTTVELVPGKRFIPLPPESLPPVALAEMVPAGGGTFRPVARICPRFFTVTRANLALLGIAIDVRTLVRLIEAGFVAGGFVSPGIRQFSFDSYQEHAARVMDDPEFWDRISPGHRFTNRQRFQQVL